MYGTKALTRIWDHDIGVCRKLQTVAEPHGGPLGSPEAATAAMKSVVQKLLGQGLVAGPVLLVCKLALTSRYHTMGAVCEFKYFVVVWWHCFVLVCTASISQPVDWETLNPGV